MKDSFGNIFLHPETALSCQVFLYKSKDDSLPTLDITKPKVNPNQEPILSYTH